MKSEKESLNSFQSSLETKSEFCKWEGCEEENIEDLFMHLKNSHLKDQVEYKCMWVGCPKYNEVSVSKGGVYSHCRTHIPNLTKSHSIEKNWNCQICNIDFKSMSVYYRHKKKHQIMEKKEEMNILRISALSKLLEAHKKDNKELINSIYAKGLTYKFLDNEILEIIKKYVKGTNIYSNYTGWEDYL